MGWVSAGFTSLEVTVNRIDCATRVVFVIERRDGSGEFLAVVGSKRLVGGNVCGSGCGVAVAASSDTGGES